MAGGRERRGAADAGGGRAARRDEWGGGAVGFGRVGGEFIRRVGESGPSDLEIDGP